MHTRRRSRRGDSWPTPSSRTRSSTRPSGSPTGICGSPTRESPTRSSRPPGQRLLRPDPAAQEEGQATPVRHGVDPGPDRGERQGQPHPRAGQALAGRGISGRDPGHPQALAALDRPRPREQALLLPDRSPGDRSSTSPKSPRRSATPGSRTGLREANDGSNPGLTRIALEDGDRHRQDGRHGHAHRLARPEQARQPAGPPVLRHVPHRHPGHHDPRPAPRAPAQRPRELLPPARPRPARPDRATRPGQDPHHQLPRLPAPRS